MNFFNFKLNEREIKLLKASRQDFRFDQDQVKNRLLASIRQAPIESPSKAYFTFTFIKYSATFAGLIIFLTATFTFASKAKPGDKLFSLNKFGENIILSLPLSMEQKAQVQAGIVTKRLEALEEIEVQTVSTAPKTKQEEIKQLETIKESDESIKNAIDTISANKTKLESSGQTADAEKLGLVLSQIDDLAKKHEDRIKTLEASLPDQKARQTVDEHLNGIKNSRHKAGAVLQAQDQKDNNPLDSRPVEQKPDTSTDMIQTKQQDQKDNNPVDPKPIEPKTGTSAGTIQSNPGEQKTDIPANTTDPGSQSQKGDNTADTVHPKSQDQKSGNSGDRKSQKNKTDNQGD